MSESEEWQEELCNELLTMNGLLELISRELHDIKQMTSPGGVFEANVAKNAALVKALADLQQLDLEKIVPLRKMEMD